VKTKNVVKKENRVMQKPAGVVEKHKSVCEYPKSAAFCHKNKPEKSLNPTPH